MKPYLLLICALLIVGCENQLQKQRLRCGILLLKQGHHYRVTIDSLEQLLDHVPGRYAHAVDSMRRRIFDLSVALASAEARHPFIRENKMDTLVRIRYKNRINGYRVSVLWQPEDVGYLGRITGTAILNFQKGDTKFSIVHNHFFLPGDLGYSSPPGYESINFDKSCIYELEQPIPENEYFQPRKDGEEVGGEYLHPWLPFFFMNNGQWLVLNMWAKGGKDTNLYRFYKKDLFDIYTPINYEPFISEITDYAVITEKEIIVESMGMIWERKIYRKVKDGYPKYQLVRIEEYNNWIDTVYTYKVEKRLVKKEGINRQ